MNKSILIFAFLFIGLMISSCRSVKNLEIRDLLHHSNCNQQNVYEYTEDSLPIPLHEQEISPLLDKKLSFNSLNMANAIGILELVSNYVELKQNPKGEDLNYRLTLLELKQAIDQKINTSSLEISAISSEMDCEEERTSQVANYLEGKIQEKESKLTVAAIVVGALGAILTEGVIKEETASHVVGISTGVAEATFGVMMLLNDEKTDFFHKRNALKDVWFGASTSKNFPAAVWYYLNYSSPENGIKTSLREQIIQKWSSFGQITKGSEEEMLELYFGEGGEYTSEQLENRADMYDQLESNINLMKQDLKALASELERL
ncbi:hypothetical protein [Sphingobacterium cellulitidis]|uniref:Lipoprotein n=1 Tax=Sphingobacterium cellulitidis TaxID=1768011 RepID=A0A8H9KUZ4_9SPHI|nr:hypothetical protein [Sphingobacterium soli]MBA8986762.1 hypothetical protein [Sphingobacterium soli]GGE13750.1 hypothetical protein GCM10011516_09490 [Sphingobacterium soli]